MSTDKLEARTCCDRIPSLSEVIDSLLNIIDAFGEVPLLRKPFVLLLEHIHSCSRARVGARSRKILV